MSQDADVGVGLCSQVVALRLHLEATAFMLAGTGLGQPNYLEGKRFVWQNGALATFSEVRLLSVAG